MSNRQGTRRLSIFSLLLVSVFACLLIVSMIGCADKEGPKTLPKKYPGGGASSAGGNPGTGAAAPATTSQ